MAPEELDPTRTVMVTIATLPLPGTAMRRPQAKTTWERDARGADEQTPWARREAEEAARQARQAVEEQVREAKRALMSARVDLRQQIENDLDIVTKSVEWLEQRSEKAPTATWTEIYRLLREVTAARDAVERDLHDFRPTTSGELKRMKRGLEMRVAELKHSLHQIELRI
jgi:hypothetical protein